MTGLWGKYLRQNRVGSNQIRSGLECASGGCITSYQYQPNGNQMCMVNFESKIHAKNACEKFQCDLIVKYTEYQLINGKYRKQGNSKMLLSFIKINFRSLRDFQDVVQYQQPVYCQY